MYELQNKARYTVSEAARLCGLHENTIRRLADGSKIPCQRDYNNYRIFTLEAIEQLRQMAGIKNQNPATGGTARVGMNA